MTLSEAPAPAPEPVRISCDDGFDLAGRFYRSAATRPSRGAVLVSGATGVPQGFYSAFAAHLASRGFPTLTYDYRGVGSSRPGSLRGFDARMQDWARRDASAALAWLRQREARPLFLVGHSLGGQLVGLVRGHEELRAILSVATSTGTWWEMSGSYRIFCAFVWYILAPLGLGLAGYLPARRLGLGEDLPAGVAREWSRWCRSADYFGRHLPPEDLQAMRDVRQPWRSIAFTDDPIANRTTVPALLSFYPNASLDSRFVAPHEIGASRIGHLGFFSRRRGDRLWPLAVEFLEAYSGPPG
jgi:predicted alpha/beta hydrolase